MARKRLSDLLKEEINPENPSESSPNPKESVKEDLTFVASKNIREEQDKSLEELTQALTTAHREIELLKNQVNKLQTSVQEKNQQIQSLQAVLSQAKASEAELTSQLQAYQSLSLELVEKEKLIETLYSKLQTAEKETKPLVSSVEQPSQPLIKHSSLSPVLRYVAPTQTPSLSNEDIGWFD